MKLFTRTLSVLAALAALTSAQAATTTVNFDEFTSPPVTCCFSNSVVGPVVYPTVTIDGGLSGTIMNSGGWSSMQTSGDNLYGTLAGAITFDFSQAISALSFDVINGAGNADFTVNLYSAAHTLLATSSQALNGFGAPGSVGHFSFGTTGVFKAEVLGNNDFAVDTISFQTSAVPEPQAYALIFAGLATVGFFARRRRAA
jgi:hypothetical protein